MHNAQCRMQNAQCAKRFGRYAVAVFLVLLFAPLFASALPRMPMGFKASFSNDTGRTWRQMGTLPQPFAMARATVKTSMLGQGYKLVHDIAEGDNATRRLLFWRKEEEDVILMIWQEDLYTTGVSWGISKRGTDADDEEASGAAAGQQALSSEFAQQVLQDGRCPANKEKDEN